jgi:dipeptidyl-peptidase-4
MMAPPTRRALAAAALASAALATLAAQDRLRLMPGYEQFTRMQPQLQNLLVSGAAQAVRWADDGQSLTYTLGDATYRFDLASMRATPQTSNGGPNGRGGAPSASPLIAARGGLEQAQGEMPAEPMAGCPRTRVPRGRQAECALSPDGRRKAFYRARNLWIANANGSNEQPITTDGSVAGRIKNGSGSWVYGEELDQDTAIWWSPDSTKVAYYRFDESQVPDFYLGMNQTGVQSALDVEAYPKAGAPNPIPEVFVHDLATGRSTRLDVRSGRPFANDVVGHYVYNVRWSPDGSELLMHRSNRRQQILEFTACSPATAACRVIVREEWPTGWVDSRPGLTWLADNRRFIWNSERNGWGNYYLYDLSGRLIAPLTSHTTFEVASIVKVDEKAGVLFYMARDGDNPLKLQLHRVGLDGRGDVRLTNPASHHTVTLSPDTRYFVDVYQTHNTPPATRLMALENGRARAVASIAESDTSQLDALGLRRAEQFTYTAADGMTPLIGQITFPSTFDPSQKWPVLVSVYGGPASSSLVPSETFTGPVALAEYGFLVVNLSSRAAPGMGRRALDSIYMKLGVTEIDDMAKGIVALRTKPYVDPARIGMYGTSYGGYVSALMILRYPDLVAAASSSSPVASWHHYDSIYTERYMWIPQENEAGYEAGNAAAFAKNLKGRLLLYYGTADNNVHPNNAMQLIRALQAAGKSFEVQVGPDAGHSGVNPQRMMEFFIENLVMRPERATGV